MVGDAGGGCVGDVEGEGGMKSITKRAPRLASKLDIYYLKGIIHTPLKFELGARAALDRRLEYIVYYLHG